MRDLPNIPKHVKSVQEAYSHYTQQMFESNGGGPSSAPAKSRAGDQPASGHGDDDDAEFNSKVVDAWTTQLQILTIVTAFLASIDGELFSLTTLNTEIGLPISTTSREIVYACLAGALIMHVCACILGYIASFVLVRYRIVDAVVEEGTKVGDLSSSGLGGAQLVQRPSRRIVREPVHPLRWLLDLLQDPGRLPFLSISRSPRSSSPPPPPLSILKHCYYTTLMLAAAGFAMAVTGILAFIWAGLPVPVRISSTVCLGIGISASLWAITM